MLVNDRSYLPLRFITETFGFTVDYDHNNKRISIKGLLSQDSTTPTFSDEQQAVITAISGYEAQSTLLVKGTMHFLGEDKEIEASITRKQAHSQLIETIMVKDNQGKQYKATRQATRTGRSVGISEVSHDGREEVINLFPYAGLHPYIELTNLKLSGLNKYGQMTIAKEQETAEIITYNITELNGEKLHVVVSIQKDNGRLIHYTEETEYSQKSLSF